MGVFLLSTSCNKTCSITEEDSDAGEILENVIVYPVSGYLTSNMGDSWVINESNVYSGSYNISTDGGHTREPADYSTYTILGFPLAINCDAAFIREVTINHETQTVVYTITVIDCNDGCDVIRLVENYVAVPAFPENYTVLFNQK